jgi:uncharacterized protein YodC (DUF2158 family)
MSDRFRPGDLVRRESGGPLMMVIADVEADGKRSCQCRRFDDKSKMIDEYFGDADLEPASVLKSFDPS